MSEDLKLDDSDLLDLLKDLASIPMPHTCDSVVTLIGWLRDKKITAEDLEKLSSEQCLEDLREAATLSGLGMSPDEVADWILGLSPLELATRLQFQCFDIPLMMLEDAGVADRLIALTAQPGFNESFIKANWDHSESLLERLVGKQKENEK